MSLQGEVGELRAQVSTLTATLNDFMTNQMESVTILIASLKAEMNKNNKPEDTPTASGLRFDSMEIQPSLSTLEALAQNENEGFTEYLTRWRRIYTQIPNRPTENELVAKFVDSLEHTYQGIMRCSGYMTFKDVTMIGLRIEVGIRSGTLPKPVGQGILRNDSKDKARVVKRNVLDILSSQTENSQPPRKKARREFTPIPISYREAFRRLRDMNLLSPLQPTIDPPTDKRPIWWDVNAFCIYHRGEGHDTEHCYRLKHKIQNMLDSGIIPVPPKRS
jgi:hypothetical protein